MSVKRNIKNAIHSLIRMCKEKEYIPIARKVYSGNELAGKVALVTGGTSGIGLEIAKNFVQCGAEVIVAGTNTCKLRELDDFSGSIRSCKIDVIRTEELYDKVLTAADLFPEKRIDILVNSAGVVNTTPFLEMKPEEFDRVMEINARGTYFMSQAVARFMIEHKIKGHILNIASSSALRPAWTPYQLSKWAVRGMTLGLADVLLPYGITVNCLAPGPVATPMLGKKEGDSIYEESYPAKRYAMPAEIAQLAVFMVSDQGNLIVGDTFFMTGGSGLITLHH
ncbi:SDR family NAD(P)-dependent oxidoreductase [Mitsuokella jalaludinii]|uniref:3-oxoacyl-[acyl-carrier-protein] reductase FabG n=1 Tax=Mitsuokella jalaludinii TaxID=187979 RepID=A0A173XJJ8_9FIRM|nr:SDR family oxidoreductase [Mitsuokella jalaludinii]CUN51829.1 3-oxoacyl-[acyl-carrier-protein] reductase FabG [Mitsuokella jalaludinii]